MTWRLDVPLDEWPLERPPVGEKFADCETGRERNDVPASPVSPNDQGILNASLSGGSNTS
jgi:hypothetical protein